MIFAEDGKPLFLDGAISEELAREAAESEASLASHTLAELVDSQIPGVETAEKTESAAE